VIQSVLHLVLCMPAMGPRKTKPDNLWLSRFLNSAQAIQWISRCSKKQAFLTLVLQIPNQNTTEIQQKAEQRVSH
jgi:hypothetical protein